MGRHLQDRARPRALRRSLGPGLAAAGLVLVATTAWATTYYVRPDGGSASECTGTADAPYPGSGSGLLCAWNHPFQALPPCDGPCPPARIAGGDTLVVASGSYRMGYGAPGSDTCDPSYPWDCHLQPVPSGPTPEEPTRILGVGWDDGCAAPPELWATERASPLLDLSGASHLEIACLELTDHEGCAQGHSGGLACPESGFPYGDWGGVGLYAEDSDDVTLRDLDVHGLADAGLRVGRLTDWTVEKVRIAGHGWVGWDGDIDGPDSNGGTIALRRVTIEWNGCVESWPGGEPTGCWAQSAGGYGDGLGTGETAGTWIVEDSVFQYNTSDGLDLLHSLPGIDVTIRRSLARGNAGNPFKAQGPVQIENSIAVADCSFFEGAPFTFWVDACRALGNALDLTLRAGDEVEVVNSTITGEGDCLVVAESAGSPDGSERVVLRNDVFLGNPQYGVPGDTACLVYTQGFAGDPVDGDYSVIDGVDGACLGPHDQCGVDPMLVDPALHSFDARPRRGSPVIDAALAGVAPPDDFTGALRDLAPDIGAYELLSLFRDGFEAGDTSAWDLTVGDWAGEACLSRP